METKEFTLSVNLPTLEEFKERFPQYGNFAMNEGRFLYEQVVSPECFNNARVATLVFQLPAVTGIANSCYQSVMEQGAVEWRGFLKQFIGAVVCTLMESNGFEKSGKKRSVPHPEFTKGEVYQLVDDGQDGIDS